MVMWLGQCLGCVHDYCISCFKGDGLTFTSSSSPFTGWGMQWSWLHFNQIMEGNILGSVMQQDVRSRNQNSRGPVGAEQVSFLRSWLGISSISLSVVCVCVCVCVLECVWDREKTERSLQFGPFPVTISQGISQEEIRNVLSFYFKIDLFLLQSQIYREEEK